jgi:hypothetical protein
VKISVGVERVLANQAIFNIQNLVIWVRSKVNGFASEDGERMEVSVFSVQVSASMFLFPDT